MRIRGSSARRALLGATIVLLGLGVAMAHKASASGGTRTLSLYEIHTKEHLTVTYMRDGKYDEEALKKLNHFMRDWRAEESTEMDRELVDLIWTLHEQLGSKKEIHLISGYRSAGTNAKLRKSGGGQAKKSQHIQGKAADIHFPDVPVKKLRNSALVHEVGGVGYYPNSGIPFVHVDTGHVRMWPRIPRLELAALFPSGKTDYLPSGGGPITKKDYELALAKGLVSETMVASAAPPPTPSPERPPAPIPQPVFASYVPSQPAPMALAPADDKPAPPRFAYAAAAGGLPLPLPSLGPETDQADIPTYENARVIGIGVPEVDDEHPDELSYVPLETASLMTEASVSYSGTLTQPEQKDLGHLFEGMDKPTKFELRPTSGYQGLASVQQFSGAAVRRLYAGVDTTGPTRLAQSTR